MDLSKILKSFNVEEDKIESIKESINQELGKEFIPRTQYNKKVTELNDIKVKFDDLQASDYKSKFDTLQNDFDTYKNNVELEKTNSSKINVLKSQLEKEGVNPKLIPLLAKEFDLNNLEIKDNSIEKWEEVIKPIKEDYSDFFTTTKLEGAEPNKNPNSGGSNTKFTKEQIQAMSHEQVMQNYDAIMENLPT